MPAKHNPILFLGLTRIDNCQIKTYRKRTCQCGKPMSVYNPNSACYACIESGRVMPAYEKLMIRHEKWQRKHKKLSRMKTKNKNK